MFYFSLLTYKETLMLLFPGESGGTHYCLSKDVSKWCYVNYVVH